MKKLYSLMLLAVIALVSIPASAKSMWPMIRSIALYTSSNDWKEPIAQFTQVDIDHPWILDDVKLSAGTEFRFLAHFNFNDSEEWDDWIGSASSSVETIKKLGGNVNYEYSGPNFLIGHSGTFSFSFDGDGVDQWYFHISGKFDRCYFLSGTFNDWGEEPFATSGNHATLNFETNKTMSGLFHIIDQDYNVLGGDTNGYYYPITEDNPSATLTTNGKDFQLADESSYTFTIDNNVLTIGNWPKEVVTVSILGSTERGWTEGNATVIPLKVNETTGYYASELTAIPGGFTCEVLCHNSLTSIGNTWYRGVTDGENVIIPKNGGEFTLTTSGGKDFKFPKSGKFAFYVAPDFSSIKIYGTYNPETFSAWLLGTTDDNGEGNELNIEMRVDQTTGDYVLAETDIPAGYRFKVAKRSSETTVADVLYGSNSGGIKRLITDQDLGNNISLGTYGNELCFETGGTFTFTVSSDFSKIKIDGQFKSEPTPSHYLIGDFNDWDETTMVPFVLRDGKTMLTYTFNGDFLIRDRDGNLLGANVGGTNEHIPFTVNGNNVAITSADTRKLFYLQLPSEYTLELTSTMIFVTGFPTEGFFIAGDFDKWRAEQMTKNDDGTYEIVKTVNAGDKFKFLDHETHWYGGPSADYEDYYEILPLWSTDIPMEEGDKGHTFIINTAGAYKFFLSKNSDGLKLTVTSVSVSNDISSTVADVVSTKYVNPSGLVSTTPFAGINIVVVTRSDGSTTVKKAVFQ